jgi:hypothetical protein
MMILLGIDMMSNILDFGLEVGLYFDILIVYLMYLFIIVSILYLTMYRLQRDDLVGYIRYM